MSHKRLLRILSGFLMLCVFFHPQPVFCAGSNPAPAEYIGRSDYYLQEKWEPEKARDLLYEALAEFPDSDEILWRLSRAYIAIAEKKIHISEPENKKSVEYLYEAAMKYADRAVEINPENSMAYTQRAIAAAQLGIYRWVGSAIGLVKNTYEDAETALKLDESNDTAHFVYARTHAEVITQVPWALRRLLGFSWADMDTALYHFERAIELNPEFIMYRLYAAKAFLSAGEKDKARSLLKTALELEDQTFLDPMYRKKASQLASGIENR